MFLFFFNIFLILIRLRSRNKTRGIFCLFSLLFFYSMWSRTHVIPRSLLLYLLNQALPLKTISCSLPSQEDPQHSAVIFVFFSLFALAKQRYSCNFVFLPKLYSTCFSFLLKSHGIPQSFLIFLGLCMRKKIWLGFAIENNSFAASLFFFFCLRLCHSKIS